MIDMETPSACQITGIEYDNLPAEKKITHNSVCV